MTKEMNDITLHEATTPRKDTLSSGLVISQTPALNEVSKALTTLGSAIAHDTPITTNDLKHLEGALASLMVDIGGEPVPLEALPTNENILLWKEIEAGNFKNHRKITFLTPRVAQLLSAYKETLSLPGITTLSDTVAQALAKHQGYLILPGLTTLTTTTAQALATHKGGYLSLNALTTLSDTVAVALAKHQGFLHLPSITTLSTTTAQALAKHQGTIHCNQKIRDHIKRFKTST